MNVTFYVAAAVAVVSTLLVITRQNAMHALLYLIVSLLSVALIFFVLGAPFVAALEVIIYAGAIMVLFVFVIMMLQGGVGPAVRQSGWQVGAWVGPALLVLILIAELVYVMSARGLPQAGAVSAAATPGGTDPVAVGMALYGPYALGVELVSMLLLAGLVGAYHVGRRAAILQPSQKAYSPVEPKRGEA